MLEAELIKLYRWICWQKDIDNEEVARDELGHQAPSLTMDYVRIRNYICERLYCHQNEPATMHYC